MSWSKRPEQGCKINTAALKDTEKQPFATFWKLFFLKSSYFSFIVSTTYMMLNYTSDYPGCRRK